MVAQTRKPDPADQTDLSIELTDQFDGPPPWSRRRWAAALTMVVADHSHREKREVAVQPSVCPPGCLSASQAAPPWPGG